MFRVTALRLSNKFKKPPCPNYDAIREVVYTKFQPVHFNLQNDEQGGPYVWDQHFKGLLCSPRFEGMPPKEMYALWEKEMGAIGMGGRVRIKLQPPSRWFLLDKESKRYRGIDC